MDLIEAITHAKQVAGSPDCGTVCAYQHDRLADFLEELQTYREIGEIEYLRELVRRDLPEPPHKESLADRNCLKCGAGINWDALNDPMDYAPAFCSNCGQRLDWEGEEKYEKPHL